MTTITLTAKGTVMDGVEHAKDLAPEYGMGETGEARFLLAFGVYSPDDADGGVVDGVVS